MIEILLKSAAALGAVHRTGLVHRDVKPANILVDEHFEPRIIDFGLVKVHSDAPVDMSVDRTLTHHGDFLGTALYMAPEQVMGLSHRVGPATDVHALGVILYLILCGKLPFSGQTPVELGLAIADDLPPFPKGLPPALQEVCRRCLEKVPALRFSDGVGLAAALAGAIENRPVAARKPGRLQAAAPIAVASVLAVAAGAALLWPSPHDQSAKTTGSRRTLEPRPERGRGLRSRIEGASTRRPAIRPFGPMKPWMWRQARRNEKGFWEVENRADGSVLIWIPPGEFLRGSDTEESNEKPARTIHISGFWIGKHEITNEQYRRFLLARPEWRKGGREGRQAGGRKVPEPLVRA